MFTYQQEGGQFNRHTSSESLLCHCDNRLIISVTKTMVPGLQIQNSARYICVFNARRVAFEKV